MKALANRRCRGLILVLVLGVIVLVGGALTVLATWAAEGYRTRQGDQARLAAHALTDSAVGYARGHLQEWSTHPREEPVNLDVSTLLPPNMTGSAVITFDTLGGRRICRITGAAQVGLSAATDEVGLNMPSS